MKKNSLVQLTQDLGSLTNADQFWGRIKSELACYGVTSVFYGAATSPLEVEVNGYTRSLLWRSDHPKEWFETYGEDSFLDEEIGIEKIFSDLESLIWQDLHICEDTSAEQIQRLNEERDMGLFVGFTVKSHALNVGHLGAIGVNMGELSPVEFNRLWPEKQREVLAICGLLDMGMREQHLRSVVNLSPRQEECLVWLAAGLTPGQIADRLGLADKTIEHHISAAKNKLNVSTRDHAVAKALLLNLIKP